MYFIIFLIIKYVHDVKQYDPNSCNIKNNFPKIKDVYKYCQKDITKILRNSLASPMDQWILSIVRDQSYLKEMLSEDLGNSWHPYITNNRGLYVVLSSTVKDEPQAGVCVYFCISQRLTQTVLV